MVENKISHLLWLAECFEVRALGVAELVAEGSASAREVIDLLEAAEKLGAVGCCPRSYEPFRWLREELRLENNQDDSR